MEANISYNNRNYQIRLDQPLPIAIPLKDQWPQLNAFYAPPLQIDPVKTDSFIGDTGQGGLVNFKNVKVNPHGNGTHTECVGHISKKTINLPACLKQSFFLAELISVYPTKIENGDLIVKREVLKQFLPSTEASAIVVRTLPNGDDKLTKNYSGNNSPYFHYLAINYLVDLGVQHLLTDLPSVDREQDDGKLLGHKAFWNYPQLPRKEATITELIYVPDEIKDGLYFLDLQITSLELDCSPSRPVLYRIH